MEKKLFLILLDQNDNKQRDIIEFIKTLGETKPFQGNVFLFTDMKIDEIYEKISKSFLNLRQEFRHEMLITEVTDIRGYYNMDFWLWIDKIEADLPCLTIKNEENVQK